jgi:hypothetical protein
MAFDRHAGDRLIGHRRDVNLVRVAALERLDRQPEDLLRSLARVRLVELDVRGARNLRNGHGRDDGRVVALRDLGQARHDALVVDHGRIERAGDDRQLLGERVGGGRDAVAHHHFEAGAADAHEVDAFRRSCGDRLILHLRGFGYNDLAEDRVVAVHRDVHRVRLKAAEVRACHDGCGGAEEDVRQVGGEVHAGVVADRALDGAEQDVDRIGVHAVSGAVHDLGDRGVQAGRDEAKLLELGEALRGDRGLEPDRRFLALGELVERQPRQLAGQGLVALAVAFDADARQDCVELVVVLDAVVGRFTAAPLKHRVREVLGVGRVRCGAARDAAGEPARDDRVGVGAADAQLWPCHAERIDPAWPLQAVPAAEARLAEAALGQLCLVAIPGEGDAGRLSGFQHEDGIGTDRAFHAFASGG